jgi:adenosine deaminase
MLRRLIAVSFLLSTLLPGADRVASIAAKARPRLTMDQRLAELRKNPLELYAFLYKMPKGGDLHNHLSGAIYAEDFLTEAMEQQMCIDKAALVLVAKPAQYATCPVGSVGARAIESDNALRNALIDTFSMRNFVAGKQSGHDHFFDTFDKFGAAGSGNLIAGVARRAGDQNESYLELMALSGGGPIANIGKIVGLTGDFDATRGRLNAEGLQDQVKALSKRVDQMEETRRSRLGCEKDPKSPGCNVEVRYIFQVLREFPKEEVFAQVLAGFGAAASDPRIVGVNFVQPEDGYNSMHDYHLHMQMVDYAKKIYPNVHVTLHAGELAPGLVPPDGLRFHIREAVELGHAERIGHGVDVMYEKEPMELMQTMRARGILVEINLTSNDVILGVKGDQHPLPIYRRNGVPVALSTDDEGVSRSQMTEEFQRAVLTYNLTWTDLKEMVRNSLEYSFAPGASYWRDRKYSGVATECFGGRKTAACQAFLDKNVKARLEADLEERFIAFERTVN